MGLGLFSLFWALPASSAPQGSPKITILCYHKFSQGPSPDLYTVSRQTFQEQLDYLQKKNYRVVSLDFALDLLAGKIPYPSGQPLVVITVDDGHKSFYDLAYPMMKRHGYTATLYVPTQRIGADKRWLHWEELVHLQKEGYIIASHSLDHPKLFEKSTDARSPAYREWLKKQLGESKKAIEQHLGVKIKHFAHPYGIYTQQILDTLKQLGYESAATINGGNNSMGCDPFRLKRTMVLSKHTFQDFVHALENNPLPLQAFSPTDGAMVSGKDIIISAKIGPDPISLSKVSLFLAHHEHKEFTFQEWNLQYKPAQGLAEGPYIVEIRAQDKKGTPWVGSWLFYVQERESK